MVPLFCLITYLIKCSHIVDNTNLGSRGSEPWKFLWDYGFSFLKKMMRILPYHYIDYWSYVVSSQFKNTLPEGSLNSFFFLPNSLSCGPPFPTSSRKCAHRGHSRNHAWRLTSHRGPQPSVVLRFGPLGGDTGDWNKKFTWLRTERGNPTSSREIRGAEEHAKGYHRDRVSRIRHTDTAGQTPFLWWTPEGTGGLRSPLPTWPDRPKAKENISCAYLDTGWH